MVDIGTIAFFGSALLMAGVIFGSILLTAIEQPREHIQLDTKHENNQTAKLNHSQPNKNSDKGHMPVGAMYPAPHYET